MGNINAMPAKQQTPQSKQYLSVRRSWPVVGLVATLAGATSWFIFNRLIDEVLKRNADGTAEGLLVGFLVTALLLQVLMMAGLLVACALAWLALWLFRVPKAGLIALCSFATLVVAAFLSVQYGSPRATDVGSVIVVFIFVFGLWTWVFLSLRKPGVNTPTPRSLP